MVKQAWVGSRADEGVVQRSRQSRGRGTDVGRRRADVGVVQRSRQSRGREADVGRRRADVDGGGDPRQTLTVAGEGTGTTDKGRTDADIELRLTQRQRL